jgi:UbiD family decarboxylase
MIDLRSFIEELEKTGDITHIEDPLSPRFEIPAMLRRFESKMSLLFENVEGHKTNVVGGICGNRERIIKALGVKPESFYEHIMQAVRNPTSCVVGDGPVKEVVERPNLRDIPVLTHFEGDPGPYITSGILYARSPDGEVENVSFHRLLVLDENRMTLRIVPRHLYRIIQMARRSGLNTLDISISLGLHPAVLFAAASPAPFGTSEYDVANNLLGGGLKLTKCVNVDALAPANAELVIEGRLRFDEEFVEGPFVDLSGTYDVERRQPVIEVVGIMHRSDFIYQALLPSGAEHRLLMGMPREVRIWNYVRNVVPTVRGVNMTLGGCGWLHCVVSFEKFREGDPKNVLMAIFAAHPSLKHAVVVDSDIDPFDMEQVEWSIATRFRGDEDLLVVPHVRVFSLDTASDQQQELGCKVGVDATRPITKPQDGFMRPDIPISERLRSILDKYEL